MPALLSPWTAVGSRSPSDSDPERMRTQQILFQLLSLGKPVEYSRVRRILSDEVISALEHEAILRRVKDCFTTGEYRLVYHLGLFLFCHSTSSRAKFYYGTDSIALSRMLNPTEGSVLDLCAGVGAQALYSARTASSVTAVELEPSAEAVFWVNAAMNGLGENIKFLCGDLFEPIAAGRFDRICANPPFVPAPANLRLPLFAGGGTDGLDIVRRILQGLPQYLSPTGQCQIIAAALGNSRGPDLSSLQGLPVSPSLRIEVSCYTYDVLSDRRLALFAATALQCGGTGNAREEYAAHFRDMKATHLYYFVLTAGFA